jgi:hypothetical protein
MHPEVILVLNSQVKRTSNASHSRPQPEVKGEHKSRTAT